MSSMFSSYVWTRSAIFIYKHTSKQQQFTSKLKLSHSYCGWASMKFVNSSHYLLWLRLFFVPGECNHMHTTMATWTTIYFSINVATSQWKPFARTNRANGINLITMVSVLPNNQKPLWNFSFWLYWHRFFPCWSLTFSLQYVMISLGITRQKQI